MIIQIISQKEMTTEKFWCQTKCVITLSLNNPSPSHPSPCVIVHITLVNSFSQLGNVIMKITYLLKPFSKQCHIVQFVLSWRWLLPPSILHDGNQSYMSLLKKIVNIFMHKIPTCIKSQHKKFYKRAWQFTKIKHECFLLQKVHYKNSCGHVFNNE